MPLFLRRIGKPSSADVTSIVYARQRHPWTARLQPNDIIDLERVCHDLILQLVHFVFIPTCNWRQEAARSPVASLSDRNELYSGCGRETLEVRSNT